MDVVFGVVLLVLASSPFAAWGIDESVFNVTKFGAISDGQTDNSQAFLKAWDAACKASGKSAKLLVPPGTTFLVNPIVVFQGPCAASAINFSNLGKIVAPASPNSWQKNASDEWLVFQNINGLTVDGGGVIDGQGKQWWDQSCRNRKVPGCTTDGPTALTLKGCNESTITDMKIMNSGEMHLSVNGCNNVTIHNVTIESPSTSPNTDGIHIAASRQVQIDDSSITCGDDCISIGNLCSGLNINNIQCTLGHGISIGSFGDTSEFIQAENINVTDCNFTQTTNGARIKTRQGGRGFVKSVRFEGLTFNNAKNPIIIDQNYCESEGKCPQEQQSAVAINNVTFRGAHGTSASDVAIKIQCSKAVQCHGIVMDTIELTSAVSGKQVIANCSNAFGVENKVVPAGQCLQPDKATQETHSSNDVAWNKIRQYISGDENILQRALGVGEM